MKPTLTKNGVYVSSKFSVMSDAKNLTHPMGRRNYNLPINRYYARRLIGGSVLLRYGSSLLPALGALVLGLVVAASLVTLFVIQSTQLHKGILNLLKSVV